MSAQSSPGQTKQQLQARIADLESRLSEAEDTLRAIREGEVDAVIVSGPKGEKIFSLSESESIYRLMVETMSEAGLAVTPEGVILFANDCLGKMLQKPLEQIVGQPMISFVHPRNHKQVQTLLAAPPGQASDSRITLVAADGHAIPVYMWANRLERPDGPTICLVGVDLTQLEASKEVIQHLEEQHRALQESEERLALATSATRIGMFEWDVDKGRVLWTQPVESILGYASVISATTTTTTTTTTTEHDYREWEDRIHPEDLPGLMEKIRRHMVDRRPFEEPYRIIWPDGSMHWVESRGVFTHDADGNAVRMLGVVTDITERKRAEEELRRTHDRFRVLTQNVASGVALIDEHGRFVIVNTAFLRLFELSEASDIKNVNDRNWSDWKVFEEDGSLMDVDEHPVRKAALSGKAVQNKLVGVRVPSGKDLKWMLVSAEPVFKVDGRIDAIICTYQDITERKRAEEALRESERRERERATDLATLLDAAPTPVFIAHDPDCRHLTGNRAADELLHIAAGAETSLSAPAETKPRHFKAVKDGRELRLDELPAQRAARGEPVSDFDFDLVFDDGATRHVLGYGTPLKDEEGRPRGAVHVLVDITDRKQAEELLRESEKRYHTLFDTMSEGFSFDEIICDETGKPCDLRYLAVNPAFERHTGLKATDIVGRTCRELFPQAEPEWFERYGKVALTGEPTHFEASFGPLNRWFEVSSYQTEPGRFAVVFFDITERKRSEEALRELNLSLEQRVAERTAEVQQRADQLRALATELSQTEQKERKRLARILHDHIQQLLVAAQLQVALIKRADAQTIQSAAQAVESIIKEAIDASRSLTVELSPPILHQAGLASSLNWLANRMQEKQLFKVHVQADNDASPADENVQFLLFESVRELLLNAVKHSGVQEAKVRMFRTREGWTKIVVEDKGSGFDLAAVQNRQVRDGSFGLFSIQQRLVHLGGRLEIESAPGSGTRAALLMPPGKAAHVAEKLAEVTPSAAGPDASSLREKGRKIGVLLVDDHKIMRQGIASILQFETDIEVIAEAEDGQKAVELARRHKPDVIIMDVNLPVMDGVEATKIITRELPQSKVIGLSMHGDKDIAAAMQKAGAVGYLTKGGPSEDLIAAIRACRRQRTTES